MSNSLGDKYRVTIFGQSHAPAVGAVIEGVPAGTVPDMDFIRAFMARRAPGGAAQRGKLLVMPRRCGEPACRNEEQRLGKGVGQDLKAGGCDAGCSAKTDARLHERREQSLRALPHVEASRR